MTNAITIEVTQKQTKNCRKCGDLITLVQSKAGKWYAVDVFVQSSESGPRALVYRKVKGASGYYAPWHTCNRDVQPSPYVTPEDVRRDLERVDDSDRVARGFALVSEDFCFTCECGKLIYSNPSVNGIVERFRHYDVTFNDNCDAQIKLDGYHVCSKKLSSAIDVAINLVKANPTDDEARAYGFALSRWAKMLEGVAR